LTSNSIIFQDTMPTTIETITSVSTEAMDLSSTIIDSTMNTLTDSLDATTLTVTGTRPPTTSSRAKKTNVKTRLDLKSYVKLHANFTGAAQLSWDAAGKQTEYDSSLCAPKCNLTRCEEGQGSTWPHESDCSQYYRCTTACLCLLECKEGFLFDPKRNKCQPDHQVDCDIVSFYNLLILHH
jgi:hypothetical protein